jgi:hypothetical protein
MENTSESLKKEDAKHRVIEALAGNLKIGEVSSTDDRIRWVAGALENGEIVHIGSFATLDEAKASLEHRGLGERTKITWRETGS